MKNLLRNTLLCCALLAIASVHALDVTTFYASRVALPATSATLYSHEPLFLGISCKSGPVGQLEGPTVIGLGDTVSAGGKSFRVGIIEVNEYNEEVRIGNDIIARKGDVICILAPDEESLPYDNDCDALWVRARGCRVVQ